MKKLFMIGGTMGVGKTTTCRILRDRLDKTVFLDGDWCWDMRPFQVTDETKAMVTDNICHMLNNFLKCSVYENVIFCWVMHEQDIIDGILSRLEGDFDFVSVSLVCGPDTLKNRLLRDVESGIRQPDVIERSIARLPMYEKLDTQKLDVSDISPEEAAARIAGMQPAPCGITFRPLTKELCRRFFQGFVSDPDIFMDMSRFAQYRYSDAAADAYFYRVSDGKRIVFSIMKAGVLIGEIQLKNVDHEARQCTLSIHMQNDNFKNKGYGTIVERMAVDYAFRELDMCAVNADAVLKNTRSQHVLEKVGFRKIGEDEMSRYYRIERPASCALKKNKLQ